MATILDLSASGNLVKLDPGLGRRLQEDRMIYLSPQLANWMGVVLPTLSSQWNIEMSPLEQLDAYVEVFASGKVLTYPHSLKPLNHLGQGVWELKTADLRIFGWFHRRDCFIAHRCDTSERIKEFNLYPGYVGEVVRFRDLLPLDEPKSVEGEDPRAVVSNFDIAH